MLVSFDVETTGKKPETDRVIQFAAVVFDENGNETYHFMTLINPGIPSSPQALAVHKITDARLAGEPMFREVAGEIRAILEQADYLVGYNVKFDVAMIAAEFKRLGQSIDLDSKPLLDPYRIWAAKEPRTLSEAHKRFVGTELDEAHDAMADVRGTARVLKGMLAAFEIPSEPEAILLAQDPDRATWIGKSPYLRWLGDRAIIGSWSPKHGGEFLYDVIRDDRGFFTNFVLGARYDFPTQFKTLIQAALVTPEEAWVQQTRAWEASL